MTEAEIRAANPPQEGETPLQYEIRIAGILDTQRVAVQNERLRGMGVRSGGALSAARGNAPSRSGAPSALDSFGSGLVNGAAFNFADEIFGADSFERAQDANPGVYGLGTMFGAAASPLTWLIGRVPLALRERGFNEALSALDRNGVVHQNLPRAAGIPLPFMDRRTREALPEIPDAFSPRVAEREQALAQTQNLLANRRSALDDYASLLATGHGVALGAGGAEAGDESILDRVLGAGVGGATGYAAARLSPEINDLSSVPFTGARRSAQTVVDLPGDRRAAPDVEGFYNRLRLFEEEAQRARTGDAFFGRAAQPTGGRDNPFVAPISDANTMVRGAIGAAARSRSGQESLRQAADQIAISDASRRAGGMRTGHAPPAMDVLPPWQTRIPQAVITDPPMRPDALRTIMGNRAFAREPQEIMSPAQRNQLARGQMDPAKRPPMTRQERQQMAKLFVGEFADAARKITALPPLEQPAAARRLLATLDDATVKRTLSALRITQGKRDPAMRALEQLQVRLRSLSGMEAPEQMTGSFGRGREGVHPVVSEAAQNMANYPMSRRMANAILDPQALRTRQEAYWLNPDEAGADPLTVLRRESIRPPWPYVAPPGVMTEVGASALSAGADQSLNALLEALRGQGGA